jgi:1-phosphofructokinase family hexose kinase
MIVVVHPNPALDNTYIVPHFRAGHTYRIEETWYVAGGKAFNCARALVHLGRAPVVVCPLAGNRGRLVADLASQEGIGVDGVWYAGETRSNLNILDLENGASTDLYERGRPLPVGIWEQVLARVAAHHVDVEAIVLCGSLAPGSDPEGVHHVVTTAREASIPVYLDTYGPPLGRALAAGPELVKINQHEAEEIVGWTVATPQAAAAAARQVQEKGARAVVITLGALGTVGIDAGHSAFAWRAPRVPVVNVAGSGDAMFAGIIAGLGRGETLPEAARLGVAAGAANVSQVVAGVCRPEDVERLLPLVEPLVLEWGG